ncbi:hypothetical protein J6590_072134 [Homalodisca vitripennis]|nr:hypothetical protein J6590_072134 [Homalodisca vitripennis]
MIDAQSAPDSLGCSRCREKCDRVEHVSVLAYHNSPEPRINQFSDSPSLSGANELEPLRRVHCPSPALSRPEAINLTLSPSGGDPSKSVRSRTRSLLRLRVNSGTRRHAQPRPLAGTADRGKSAGQRKADRDRASPMTQSAGISANCEREVPYLEGAESPGPWSSQEAAQHSNDATARHSPPASIAEATAEALLAGSREKVGTSQQH